MAGADTGYLRRGDPRCKKRPTRKAVGGGGGGGRVLYTSGPVLSAPVWYIYSIVTVTSFWGGRGGRSNPLTPPPLCTPMHIELVGINKLLY